MARTITLNGLQLDTGNYSVHEMKIDNAPLLGINTLEIAHQDGAKVISANYKPKEIEITGMISGSSEADLDARLDTFKKTVSGTRLNLSMNYAGATRNWTVEVEAIIIGDPRLHFHITKIPYSLSLSACDPPFGTSSVYSSVFSADAKMGATFSASLDFGGSASPKPYIRYQINTAGTLGEIITKNDFTNQQLEVSTAWASGDVLEIDCENLECLRNGQPIQFDGIFPEFELDDNILRSIFTSTGAAALKQDEANSQNSFHYGNASRSRLAQSFLAPATTTYPMIELALASNDIKGEMGAFIFTIETDNSNSLAPSGFSSLDSTP